MPDRHRWTPERKGVVYTASADGPPWCALQEAALQASLAAAAAMQAPASPRRAAGLATSKSAMPEDHPAPGAAAAGSAGASALGLRRRRGSLSALRRSRRAASGGLGTAGSGLHALFLQRHGSSSSLEVDGVAPLPLQRTQTAGSALGAGLGSGPLARFGSQGGGGYGGLGSYGSVGSGLLHAQSSTINLAAQDGEGSEDFFDLEDDAASFFSATSNLFGGGGSGSGSDQLPRFSDLPNSAETSTLDLLLLTGRDAPADAAEAEAAAAAAHDESSGRAAGAGKAPPLRPLSLSFAGGTALPGSPLQLRRSRVLCSGLLLRAYTEGWGVAAACVRRYLAALEAAQPAGQQAEAEEISGDLNPEPTDLAAPVLDVQLEGWLLEVVATGGTGECSSLKGVLPRKCFCLTLGGTACRSSIHS